jgi:hypothetical protein
MLSSASTMIGRPAFRSLEACNRELTIRRNHREAQVQALLRREAKLGTVVEIRLPADGDNTSA